MGNLSLGFAVAYLFGFFVLAIFVGKVPQIPLLRGTIALLFVFSVVRVIYEFLRVK